MVKCIFSKILLFVKFYVDILRLFEMRNLVVCFRFHSNFSFLCFVSIVIVLVFFYQICRFCQRFFISIRIFGIITRMVIMMT